MRPDFSEFSFGFAITAELLHGYHMPIHGYPIFPNLVEEARLGYDVKLDQPGTPMFLQFKLAEAMTRRSAIEIRDHNLPLTPTFYRIKLWSWTQSRQHQLLLDLDQSPNQVFYVAPRFYTAARFSQSYTSRTMINNSAFVTPSSVGPLQDSETHHIVYDELATRGWSLSEPRRIKEVLTGPMFLSRVAETARVRRVTARTAIEQTRRNLIAALNRDEESEFRLRASLSTKLSRTAIEERFASSARRRGEARQLLAGAVQTRRDLTKIAAAAAISFEAQLFIVQPLS